MNRKICIDKKVIFISLVIGICISAISYSSFLSKQVNTIKSEAKDPCKKIRSWNRVKSIYEYTSNCCTDTVKTVCFDPEPLVGGQKLTGFSLIAKSYILDCDTKMLTRSSKSHCQNETQGKLASTQRTSAEKPVSASNLPKISPTLIHSIIPTPEVTAAVERIKDVKFSRTDDFNYTLSFQQRHDSKFYLYDIAIKLIKFDRYNPTAVEYECNNAKLGARTRINQNEEMYLRNAILVVSFDDNAATISIGDTDSEKKHLKTISFPYGNLKYITLDITSPLKPIRLCVE